MLSEMDKIYYNAKSSAAKRGISFSLTIEEYSELVHLSNGCCMLSGILFDFSETGFKKRPYAPSIDRINSRFGYTKENCRLVCTAVNIAMNEWGEGVLFNIAYSIIANTKNSKTTAALADAHLAEGIKRILVSFEENLNKKIDFLLEQKLKQQQVEEELQLPIEGDEEVEPTKQFNKKWNAPCVARDDKSLVAFGGGSLPSARTMANLDSQGLGPKGRFRVGKKVAYPVESLVSWMEERGKGKIHSFQPR